MRPRSVLARGGSSAAHGKRSVFFVAGTPTASDYVAVNRFCVKNNNYLVGRVSAMVFDGTSSAQSQSQSQFQTFRAQPFYLRKTC